MLKILINSIFIYVITCSHFIIAETKYYASENNELPFSEAVQVDNVLYLSGQIGIIPGKGLIAGGIAAETAQTLENIKSVLEKYGSSLDQVFKCTVFLAEMNEWPAMNKVYKKYFAPQYPARSAVAGSGLALNSRVEIECIATIK